MFQQFNVSRTAFGAYQKMIFNITNNLANIVTPGFKQSRMEFGVVFPKLFEDAKVQYDADENNPYSKKTKGADLPVGIKVISTLRDFTQGSLKVTSNPHDIAVQGEGFFVLRRSNGKFGYTRAGNFQVDSDGFLRHASGYLLDPPIQLPEGSKSFTVDQKGRVYVKREREEEAQEVGQIMMATFKHKEVLKNLGQNMYEETSNSGKPILAPPTENGMGQTIQFALETSNVDMMREMFDMIIAQRGLEGMGKAMTSGGEMVKLGLSMNDRS